MTFPPKRTRPDKFILRGKIPLPCEDLMEWGRFMEGNGSERIVAQTEIDEDLRVSTVFLGLDHSHAWNEDIEDVPPLLFETIAFGERKTVKLLGQWRYSTWEQAEAGHRAVVEEMRKRFEEAGTIALVKRPEEGKT